MPRTFGDLTDEIISLLHGFVDVPTMGTLTADLAADGTEAIFDFGDQPGAARPNGIVEIDRELLVVSRFDPASGKAQLTPWGRGHRSTVAAAHAAGSMVTVRPRFPRKRVGDAINETVRAACPPLYAPRDLDPIQTQGFVGLGYPLPDDTIRVLRVDATIPSPTFVGDRHVLRDWTVRTVAGQKLIELDANQAMMTVQVTIAAEPGALVDEADEFAATTGLQESTGDAVVFGTIARLILGQELARTQVMTVEAADRADKVPAGSAINISRFYQALYTQALTGELNKLNAMYPIQLLRRG
jgi:hypothetical protein